VATPARRKPRPGRHKIAFTMPQKTGRRASTDERERAAELVRIYRDASASPDQRYCLNPDDAPEDRRYIHADDPEPLLLALGDFAEHGTFAPVGSPAHAMLDEMQVAELRRELLGLRAQGLTREAALATMAERHHRHPRTMERLLKPRE
jgi:hypothetical protein